MFKNENGFSLVELAIAAGLAVALAATAVTILSGTTATLSSKANGAAGTSSQYNYDVLNDGGAPSTPTVAAPMSPEWINAQITSPTSATIWWGSVSGATSYKVFINGEIAATLAVSTDNSYEFTGLTASTSYTLAVVAVNAGGNSSAAETVITSPAAPEPTLAELTSGGSYLEIGNYWSQSTPDSFFEVLMVDNSGDYRFINAGSLFDGLLSSYSTDKAAMKQELIDVLPMVHGAAPSVNGDVVSIYSYTYDFSGKYEVTFSTYLESQGYSLYHIVDGNVVAW